jgi:hypothetical protein
LTPILDAIADLNDFDPATEQVIVSTNNDKNNYTLANNSITSSTIANNALNNSSFTTGFFNAIKGEVDSSLADYDAPTKAELDTLETNLLDAINNGTITAQEIWDYLQTETTVSNSMKEAIEKILKNAKIIPALL